MRNNLQFERPLAQGRLFLRLGPYAVDVENYSKGRNVVDFAGATSQYAIGGEVGEPLDDEDDCGGEESIDPPGHHAAQHYPESF